MNTTQPIPHPLIQLQGICQTYTMGQNVLQALKSVDLDIEQGEFIAITGPSGGGKSTLMNILGCLDRPSAGQYSLRGEAVSDMDDDQLAILRNHSIGFVFQSFNLLSRSTALENVEMPMLYGGIKDRKERAIAALEQVGLGERLDHLPSQMSGGQRQRVAIARAIVMQPPLLFADEPTGNLDTKTSNEIMDIFLGLNSQGTTIVLVTHEPEIAEHASRVLYLRDGRIERDTRNGGAS